MSRRPLIVSAVAVSVLLLGTLAPPATAAAPPDGFTASPLSPSGEPLDGAKTTSGQLAESDPAVLERTDGAVIPALVKVDVDPVASYTGGIDGYAATSPEATGKQFSLSDPDVERYLGYVEQTLADAQAAIAAAVPSAAVLDTYAAAYGGLAVTVPARDAKALLAIPGVAAVQDDSLRQVPLGSTESSAAVPAATGAAVSAATAATPTIDNDASTFIGADKVWPSLGGRDKAGEGIVVGVIDTGIWPEHPMLADNGIAKPAGGPWKCELGNAGDAAFACNDKLVGAYAFLDTYRELNEIGAEDFCDADACSARDSEGHGTHTATTAVGSYVETAPIFGVDRGPASGVAPGASVIAYRALGPAGGYTSDLVAAVQQTILDGVDVVNYSISGSASVYTDPVTLAFLDAYAAGITVNTSAGNSGPGASTANHAGPWTTTVGASTFDREYASTLTLTASDGSTFSKSGSTLTQGVTDLPVVLGGTVAGYPGGAICGAPFAPGSLEGKVVVCERGGTYEGATIGRVQKGYNALQGGAAGMILYNPTASDVETDNHFLPTVHLEGPNTELLSFLAAHPDATATWAEGSAQQAKGDVMAGFSSRGPIGEFLKPDITAPGVQILAGLTPASTDVSTGPQGELYQAIAGTSMSSPHAAGVSALVKAAHPTWTPGQIKSALMTSSVQDVVNVDGSRAGVFDRGAGSIRADRAIAPTLTVSETAENFAASAGSPLARTNLNIPSVYVDPLPGAAVVKRTVTNVSGSSQSLTVKATGADGLSVVVAPSSFTLAAGKSREVTIVLNGLKAAAGWHEGQITISPRGGATPVVLPIAVDKGDASITLTQSCSPTEIARGATTTCTVAATNFLPVDVDARVDVAANPLLQARSATAPAKKTLLGANWSGTLAAAKPPTIESFGADTSGTDPAGEYTPLSAFGIAPATFGDDTISNFDVPAFQYGGETYTSVGVVSNGYVVIGGGSTSDVLAQPNGIPNAASPNNVIAPFWTDLNPAAANLPADAGVRVGTLTDGVDRWIVVDWNQIPDFSGTGSNTFQLWIQAGTTEGQWVYYDGAPTADPAVGSLTGAENRDGTSGKTVEPDPATVYAIGASAPVAGGTVTFDYTLKGLVRGTWSSIATLKSSALNTYPAVQTPVKVK